MANPSLKRLRRELSQLKREADPNDTEISLEPEVVVCGVCFLIGVPARCVDTRASKPT